MRPAGGWLLLMAAALTSAQAADLPRDRRTAPASATTAQALADQQRQTLVDLYLQLDQLQNEVRRLRGQLDTQGHELDQLKARQRETAADLDRRLREMERAPSQAPAAGGPSPVAPATGAGAPAAAVSEPAGGEAPVAVVAAEQQQYDAAFSLLRQGKYNQAISGFRAFLAKHPRSTLADNAQYWVGEAYYVVRNFRQAAEEFGKVVRAYPGSDKAPDAQLKVGYSYFEMGERAKAREAMAQVSVLYPKTSAARKAEERLAQMKKEGGR